MRNPIKTIFYLIVVIASHNAHSQTKEILQKINQDVWEEFIVHYGSYDAEGFMAIHSKDLVRVNRNSKTLRNFSEYNKSISNWFTIAKEAGQSQEIKFRFIERIAGNSIASEIGIYKVVSQNKSGEERTSFGKFQVILVLVDTCWKIRMDSDSSEGGKIGREEFESAYLITDFDPFINQND